MSKANDAGQQDDDLKQFPLALRNLLTTLELAAIFLDEALVVTYFTPSLLNFFPLLASDLGHPLAQLMDKIGDAALLKAAEQALQTVTPVEHELPYADEQWRLVRFLPYSPTPASGAGLLMTVFDITKSKQAEQALQESDEQTQFMLEYVQEYAIFRLDKAGYIASWNQGAERICGYAEAEAIGQPAEIIFTPEDRAVGAPASEIETAKLHGQSLDERWHMRKNGSRFWGSGVMTALWDTTGELRGFVKMMRDNTERKEAEEALQASQAQLQALNESLVERVEQRTQQMRKLATELVLAEQKERQRLAHILHDDLQQGLYALQIQLQILNETLVSAQPDIVQESLQAIKEIIGRTIRLTRHLTVELSPPVLQGEGLVEMLRWLAVQMKQRYGLEVSVSAAPISHRYSNEILILLAQLVNELLFNVVKHAGVNQAHVEIQSESNQMVIDVMDEGRGFDVEQVAHGPEGGGYGLRSIQDRLALLDGRLVVTSQPGLGTHAILYVPF